MKKFAAILRDYGVSSVTGDAHASETFRRDFEAAGICYRVADCSTSET